MKLILKFCQRYMEVAILIASQYQVSPQGLGASEKKKKKKYTI